MQQQQVGAIGGTLAAPVTLGGSIPLATVVAVEGLSMAASGAASLTTQKGRLNIEDSKKGTKGGDRAGKDFTPKGREEIIEANKQKNSGQNLCEDCGVQTIPSQKSQSGVSPVGNELQVDHIYPKSKGGDGATSNGQVLCRDCNITKGNKLPEEYYE